MSDIDPDEEPEPKAASPMHDFMQLQYATFRHQLPDPALWRWVRVVNDDVVSFDVILTVKGLIITGTLVSAAQYMNELAEEFSSIGSAAGDAFAELHREASLDLQLQVAANGAATPGHLDDWPTYLHVIRADILSAGKCVASNIRWRGRIADIDGWTIGRLTVT